MEKNRPVTIFGVVTILLACLAAVLNSVINVPEHPIRTALLAVAAILAAVAGLTALNFLMFVPLFTCIVRLCGRKDNIRHKRERV